MIDFRYHVVSIVAVFLALTVGLVIGSSYLSKVAYDELNNQLSGLRGQNQTLHNSQNELTAQVRDRDALIAALGPDAVDGKLTGRSVAVVLLPGADSGAGDAMSALLRKAGADVTGQVALKTALMDPAQAAKVAAVGAALPSESRGGAQSLPTAPATAPGSGATAAALADIAGAVVHRIPAGLGGIGEVKISDGAATTVLSAYANSGYLDVKSTDTKSTDMSAADLVVVLTGPAPQPGAVTDADDALYLGFVKDLAGGGRSMGTVLAGPASAATAPGLVGAALKDGWTSKNVSTADSADQASGRIITVFALAEELAGKTGHYGLTGTADGPLPDLR